MGRLIRYFASLLPLPLAWRASWYRASGMRIGTDVTIDRNLQVTGSEQITIGSRVTISAGVSLLGDVTTVHSRLGEEFGLEKRAPVVVGDDAIIGVKATILPGITIGRMATVAANTLVVEDVPELGVVIGVPGRVVMARQRVEPDPEE